MIIFHKEIRINGEWHHLAQGLIRSDDLWPALHQHGDSYVRGYTLPTKMDIAFHDPECYVHHITKESLISLCKLLGEERFIALFGYWPWDSILVFQEEEDTKTLVQRYGITSVRMVAWKV